MGLFSSSPSDPSTTHRLAAIERKLDAIIQQLGIELPQEDFEEVRNLALSGQTIQAIKLYREQTGSTLAQAKGFIDSIR